MGPSRAAESAETLGTAPVGRLLWTMSLQTTASVGLYGVYALTNAWFVAWGVGETALAAVNLAAPLLLIIGAVSTTVGVGGASLVSRALGAGRPDRAAAAAGNAIALFWLVAICSTVVGLLALDPLLIALGATGETLGYARSYGAIILAGAIFATGFSAIVRAEGRLAYSMLLWIVPLVVQILLDPLLIFVFHLGKAGAALGTVAGQAVSAALAFRFFFLMRDRPYRVGLPHLRLRLRTVSEVVGIGAPSFLAGFGATLLTALINQRLALVGAVALAAFAVVSRVQTFVMTPQIGLTQAAQPIIGFNVGRSDGARVARTLRLSIGASLGYGTLIAAAVFLAAGPLAGAFLAPGPAHAQAVAALRVVAVGFVVAGIAPLVSGYLQALGQARGSYLISLGSILLVKVPLVLALAGVAPMGIWLALPAGEVGSCLLAVGLLAWRRGQARSSPKP